MNHRTDLDLNPDPDHTYAASTMLSSSARALARLALRPSPRLLSTTPRANAEMSFTFAAPSGVLYNGASVKQVRRRRQK